MPTTMESTSTSSASTFTPSSPASGTSGSSGTAISPFFSNLPLEIREQIYWHVFAGSLMLVNGHEENSYCVMCRGLEKFLRDTLQHRDPPFAPALSLGSIRFQGPANYRVLLTCQAIYQEARPILASSLNIYICDFETSHSAVQQILCALKHDTFLRYAIPHIQCLNVPWNGDALLPTLRHLSTLQELKVKAWYCFIPELMLSVEICLSPKMTSSYDGWIRRLARENLTDEIDRMHWLSI